MLGPLFGGVLVTYLGLGPTYLVVGGSLAMLGLANRVLIPETHRVTSSVSGRPSNPFRNSMDAWATLLRDHRVRKLASFQSIYWVALSGTQFTLLPLHVVALGFTPVQLGICFAIVSATNFLTAQPFARLADRRGKVLTMLLGAAMTTLSFALIPHVPTFEAMAALCVCLGMSNTLLSATPLSLISDYCSDKDRPQALSLIRIAQDVGFLLGASGTGLLSMLMTTTLPATLIMQIHGALVMVAAPLLLLPLRKRKKVLK